MIQNLFHIGKQFCFIFRNPVNKYNISVKMRVFIRIEPHTDSSDNHNRYVKHN